jgi:hypothetical protein
MIKDGANLGDVIKVLEGNFKGAADVAGRSAKGQLALMNGAFTDMKESLGMALLPALEAVIPMLVKFSDWAANHVNVVIGIGTAIAGIATAIATYVAVQKTANAVMVVATALNWAMAASETAKNTAMTLGVGAAAIAAGLVVAMGALTIFKNKTKDLTVAQVEQNKALTATATGLGTTSEMIYRSDRAQIKAAYATAYATEEIKKQTTATGGNNDKLEEMADRIKKVSDALNDYMVVSLKDAKESLDDAQKNFDDFATNVSSSIKDAFSFKDAKDAGDETGSGFLAGLRDQVQGIINYGTDVEALLKRGLSQDALQAVLAAGGESGAAIAHELVLGAQDNITGPDGVNVLVKSAQDVADRIGLNAANQWYGAGVSSAQSYLQGVEAAFAAAQAKLGAKGLKLPDVKGIGAAFDYSISNPSVTPISPMAGNRGIDRGYENQYVINVSGVMSNAQTGEEIVNNIRAYNRAAGPANILVS